MFQSYMNFMLIFVFLFSPKTAKNPNGSGRPPGSKNKKTLELEKTKQFENPPPYNIQG